MKCTECGHAPLQGLVTIQPRMFDLTTRRGSVVVDHQPPTKLKDWKDAWDYEEDGSVRKVRGPIICPACMTEYVYCVGESPALINKLAYEERTERARRKEERDLEALPSDDSDE